MASVAKLGYSKYTKWRAKKAYNKATRYELSKQQSKLKQQRNQAKKAAKMEKRLDPNTKMGRKNILTQEQLERNQAKIRSESEIYKRTPDWKQKELENKLKIAEIAEEGTAKAGVIGAGAGSISAAAKAIESENDSDDEKMRLQEQVQTLMSNSYVSTASGDNSNGLTRGVE